MRRGNRPQSQRAHMLSLLPHRSRFVRPLTFYIVIVQVTNQYPVLGRVLRLYTS